MDMMAYSIAINGSFFNTQRMMQEYVLNATNRIHIRMAL
jgi:starch phosphorylase